MLVKRKSKPVPVQAVLTGYRVCSAAPSGLARADGSPVGSMHKNGQWVFNLPRYGQYKVARLVWVLLTGTDPSGCLVGHRNGVLSDNAPDNLHLVTAHKPVAAYTGVKGLSVAQGRYWVAQVIVQGVRHRKTFGAVSDPSNKAAAIAWLWELRGVPAPVKSVDAMSAYIAANRKAHAAKKKKR